MSCSLTIIQAEYSIGAARRESLGFLWISWIIEGRIKLLIKRRQYRGSDSLTSSNISRSGISKLPASSCISGQVLALSNRAYIIASDLPLCLVLGLMKQIYGCVCLGAMLVLFKPCDPTKVKRGRGYRVVLALTLPYPSFPPPTTYFYFLRFCCLLFFAVYTLARPS